MLEALKIKAFLLVSLFRFYSRWHHRKPSGDRERERRSVKHPGKLCRDESVENTLQPSLLLA